MNIIHQRSGFRKRSDQPTSIVPLPELEFPALRCSPNPVHFLCKFNFLQVLIISLKDHSKGGFQELLLQGILFRGYVS